MPWCIPIKDRHHLLLNSTVKCCATFLYRRRFTWFLTVNELFASDIVPVPFSSNFTVKEAEPSFKQKKYLLVMNCERKHMNYRKCKMVDLFLRQLDSCTAPEWVHERQKRKNKCKTPKKHSFNSKVILWTEHQNHNNFIQNGGGTIWPKSNLLAVSFGHICQLAVFFMCFATLLLIWRLKNRKFWDSE